MHIALCIKAARALISALYRKNVVSFAGLLAEMRVLCMVSRRVSRRFFYSAHVTRYVRALLLYALQYGDVLDIAVLIMPSNGSRQNGGVLGTFLGIS